jgi:uncharacterized membrane protein (UPF0127 family)
MRRFESTPSVRLRAGAGPRVDAWVAEGFAARLAGLALLPGLPRGRALLLPCCRSVHTAGMRFAIDVAFVTWPPGAGTDVLALRCAVSPWRLVAPRGLPLTGVAVLESVAGALAAVGVRAGVRLGVEFVA